MFKELIPNRYIIYQIIYKKENNYDQGSFIQGS